MALLLITHDLGIVRKMADRVYVMNPGRIVESGLMIRVFDAPEHPYTRHLLAATPGGGANRAPPEADQAMQVERLKVLFPIRRGVPRRTVGHVRAMDGFSLEVGEGETWAWSTSRRTVCTGRAGGTRLHAPEDGPARGGELGLALPGHATGGTLGGAGRDHGGRGTGAAVNHLARHLDRLGACFARLTDRRRGRNRR